MKNEFVIYEQAVALKELGFDEPCFGYWKSKNWIIQEKTRTDGYAHADQECSAPTYSQSFRWFREKYNLKAYIIPIEYLDGTQETYQWNIFNKCHSGVDHLTYEEAESACLDKLIEIVKNK